MSYRTFALLWWPVVVLVVGGGVVLNLGYHHPWLTRYAPFILIGYGLGLQTVSYLIRRRQS